jgi:hypothetical protein
MRKVGAPPIERGGRKAVDHHERDRGHADEGTERGGPCDLAKGW